MKRVFAERDGNAYIYYYGESAKSRVLLERCLIVTGHRHEHMILVVRALRRINGEDMGYHNARALWDNHAFWYNNLPCGETKESNQ